MGASLHGVVLLDVTDARGAPGSNPTGTQTTAPTQLRGGPGSSSLPVGRVHRGTCATAAARRGRWCAAVVVLRADATGAAGSRCHATAHRPTCRAPIPRPRPRRPIPRTVGPTAPGRTG